MARGAHEIPKKNKFPAWGLILLLLLTLSVGGVTAYLSASSDTLTNKFTVAPDAVVAVNQTMADPQYSNNVVVTDQGYAVYLRAAVVVNWEKTVDGKREILSKIPEASLDYSLSAKDESPWIQLGDGFYYYRYVIADSGQFPPPVSLQVLPGNRHPEYELKMTVYAQTVQAVGTTDEDHTTPNKDAVFDAWGVEASAFLKDDEP